MQELLTIRAHLYRLGVLCTDDYPTGVSLEPLHQRYPLLVRLYDPWMDYTYDAERLLGLLPNATAENFWSDIQDASLDIE